MLKVFKVKYTLHLTLMFIGNKISHIQYIVYINRSNDIFDRLLSSLVRGRKIYVS